jgi:hypothetical protein
MRKRKISATLVVIVLVVTALCLAQAGRQLLSPGSSWRKIFTGRELLEQMDPVHEPTPLVLPANAERLFNVKEVVDKAISTSKSLVFLSWNGKWIGTDCDTEIEFFPDHSVVLTEFGVGVEKFKGSYSISSESVITLSLSGYRAKWPGTRVWKDGKDLLLAPSDGSNNFIFGERGGATLMGDGTFWPFRQVEPR